MPAGSRRDILDDECTMIRNSGEIPEVALHNALHYLTQDADGPGLILQTEEIRQLQTAVIGRYRRIILRDLDSRLRDKSVYRGIARSITNWERLTRFAAREKFALQDLKAGIAAALELFLKREIDDIVAGKRAATSIDCSRGDLLAFCTEVGFDPQTLPADWQRQLRLD